MKTKNIIAERDRIDELFQKVKTFPVDPEVSSHCAKYLCVIVNGFIENCLREIFRQYAEKRASSEIVNYVTSGLEWESHSPNFETILQIASRFDSNLREEFEKVDPELKDSVNSVVNNRHQIAHGKSVSLSYARMEEYYKKIKDFVDIMEARVLL